MTTPHPDSPAHASTTDHPTASTPQPGRPVRGSATGRPIMALFDLAGRRWTLRVVWELDQAATPLTFRQLRAACGDISSSLLTRRLHELAEARIVERAPNGYTLTPTGTSLVTAMTPLLHWSENWNTQLHDH